MENSLRREDKNGGTARSPVITSNFLWGWEGLGDVLYTEIFWKNKEQSLREGKKVMLEGKTTLFDERKKCFSHRSLFNRESGEETPRSNQTKQYATINHVCVVNLPTFF